MHTRPRPRQIEKLAGQGKIQVSASNAEIKDLRGHFEGARAAGLLADYPRSRAASTSSARVS